MAIRPTITGNRHMISAGHYLATQAGFEVLEAGGNAIDAGVAAGIALGVVQSDIVQFSGVAPIILYSAEHDEVVTISGLGYWPSAASLELFVDQHGGSIPIGLLRTVVPAAPDAWITALDRYGTMHFADVAGAAIRYAREGFSLHPLMVHFIESHAEQYGSWPTNAAIYLPNGAPPKVGDLFRQADLARSLQFMADQEAAAATGGRHAGLMAARDAFYRGDLAHAMVDYHRDHGGLLTADDLAGFRSGIEPPLRARFGEIDVFTCGPWCQGPVLLQMLSLLEGFDLPALGHNSADYIHVVAEAMKLAFADRERYYGDPKFVDVPIEALLSEAYAERRRNLIRDGEAWPEMPPAGEAGPGAGPGAGAGTGTASAPLLVGEDEPDVAADTSYVCVVDGAGNVFSATPSDVSFQGPVIPGTGFCPSSRGSQSFAVPGHASAVAPGKRPRLTPNPALAMRPGRFAMPFGTPGGDAQCQAMVQFFLNTTVFGMGVQEAVEAPRFITHSFPNSFEPHESYPGRLNLERRIDDGTGDTLAARGHQVNSVAAYSWRTGGICAITANLESGVLAGAADPRRSSRAMGW